MHHALSPLTQLLATCSVECVWPGGHKFGFEMTLEHTVRQRETDFRVL